MLDTHAALRELHAVQRAVFAPCDHASLIEGHRDGGYRELGLLVARAPAAQHRERVRMLSCSCRSVGSFPPS